MANATKSYVDMMVIWGKNGAKRYTDAAVVQNAGVPIYPPRINSGGFWEIWQPMTGTYLPTTISAIGQDGHSPVVTHAIHNFFKIANIF